jgi:2-oxoglutarate dehydrogenase E1 component
MGAASYLTMNLDLFPFRIIARNPSAATATGYNKIHLAEQQEILKQAIAYPTSINSINFFLC